MTTVVASRSEGAMVSDSIAVDEKGLKHLCYEKVMRFKIGGEDALLGFAGGLADCLILAHWVQIGAGYGDRPTFPPDAEAECLVLTADAIRYYDTRCVAITIYEEFAALGTGEHLALGAMHAGASAEEAVEIAVCYDSNTGGEVRSHYLDRSKAGEA